jgi:hypothetical protein
MFLLNSSRPYEINGCTAAFGRVANPELHKVDEPTSIDNPNDLGDLTIQAFYSAEAVLNEDLKIPDCAVPILERGTADL